MCDRGYAEKARSATRRSRVAFEEAQGRTGDESGRFGARAWRFVANNQSLGVGKECANVHRQANESFGEIAG